MPPTVVAVHTEVPDSWALAELDANLAVMDSAQLRQVFTLALVRYDAAIRRGRPEELLDVFEAAARDAAPQPEGRADITS